MAGWAGDLRHVNEDKAWWETAYRLFLNEKPLQRIGYFAGNFKTNNIRWDDCAFRINSVVPYYGVFNGVDTRAIIVVLAIARVLEDRGRRFNDLRGYIQHLAENNTDQGEAGQPLQPLTIDQINLINVMMRLMYNENGNPIQRDQPRLLLDLTNAEMMSVFDLIHAKIRPNE